MVKERKKRQSRSQEAEGGAGAVDPNPPKIGLAQLTLTK